MNRRRQRIVRGGTVVALMAFTAVLLTGCLTIPPTGGSGAVVVGDHVFVASVDGSLQVRNAEKGVRVWDVEMEGPKRRSSFIPSCGPAAAVGVAIYGTPAVDGNKVYVAGYDGRLRLYDWVARYEEPLAQFPALAEDLVGPIVSGIVVGDGMVYFGTGLSPDDDDIMGAVYALDAETLLRRWTYTEFTERVWATPLLHDGTLYVSSFDGTLYALDAANGALRWKFQTEGALAAAPALHDGTLYFGSFDLHFYAVDAASGSLKWRSQEGGGKWFWATPAIHGDRVYAPNLDGKVYVYDTGSGAPMVSPIDLGSPAVTTPVVSGDYVFVGVENAEVYRIDTGGGQKMRFYDESATEGAMLNAPLTLVNGVIYVHTQAPDRLYAFNVADGVSQWAPVPLSEK